MSSVLKVKENTMSVSIEVTIQVTVTCDACGHSEQFDVDNNSVADAELEYEDYRCEECEEE